MARVALVTGGARGIGAAICRALAEQGRSVAVCDVLADDAAATAEALTAAGATAMAVGADITDSASVRAAVAAVQERLGPVDILVNNAGWDELKPFLSTDEDFWRRVLDVNFLGALRLTHAVAPGMVERGWGRIVSTGSDAGRVGSSLEAVYSGAKGGIIAFTKSLARELATKGVTANVVCPGPTRTPLLDGITASAPNAAKVIGAMERAVPMKRLGEPQDVAGAVAYFTSDAAAYVTGQTLSVSGGLTMA